MTQVPVVYEFDVIAGPNASVNVLVRESWRIAAEFFRDERFDLEIQVRGRSKQWEASARATRVVERGD